MSEKHNPFDKPKNKNSIFWLTPGEKVKISTVWQTHTGFTKYGETTFLEVVKDKTKMDLIVPKKLSFILYDVFEEVNGAPVQLIIERDEKKNNYQVAIVSEES